jgi:hypothetical protein
VFLIVKKSDKKEERKKVKKLKISCEMKKESFVVS